MRDFPSLPGLPSLPTGFRVFFILCAVGSLVGAALSAALIISIIKFLLAHS